MPKDGKKTCRTVSPQPEYLTFGDLSSHLQVSERTIHRMVDAGQLPPPQKFRNLTRFSRRAVETYLESKCSKKGGVR